MGIILSGEIDWIEEEEVMSTAVGKISGGVASSTEITFVKIHTRVKKWSSSTYSNSSTSSTSTNWA